MLWIPITLFAAVFQTIRTAIQKNLKDRLSTHAITFTRYGFGLPFALLYLIFILCVSNASLPTINPRFLFFCILGGVVQIWGTSSLVAAFSYKNFAVSSTYAKTEALLAAILGVVFFKEYLSWTGFLVVCVGMSGVALMSLSKESRSFQIRDLFEKGPLLGVAAGFFFALTSLSVRHASLSLESGDVVLRAAFTLVVMVSIQVGILLIYLAFKERDQFSQLKTHWKGSTLVGLTAILGSIAWFTAMTLQNVAYVKMIGQVELLFSVFIAMHFFKERVSLWEVLGMLVIGGSIIGLVWVL